MWDIVLVTTLVGELNGPISGLESDVSAKKDLDRAEASDSTSEIGPFNFPASVVTRMILSCQSLATWESCV